MESFEQNRDNKILFDWFAFTVHDLSLDEVFNLLGFSNLISDFISMSGSNGYNIILILFLFTITDIRDKVSMSICPVKVAGLLKLIQIMVIGLNCFTEYLK